jgi:hypothetical protein
MSIKTFEVEAKGMTFAFDIESESPLGQFALNSPLPALLAALKASAEDVTYENIDEMNAGSTQVWVRILEKVEV